MHIWDSRRLPPSPPTRKSTLSVFVIHLTSFPAGVPEHRPRVQAVPLRRSVHGCGSDSCCGVFIVCLHLLFLCPSFALHAPAPANSCYCWLLPLLFLRTLGTVIWSKDFPAGSWLVFSKTEKFYSSQSLTSAVLSVLEIVMARSKALSHSLPSTMALKGTESSNS